MSRFAAASMSTSPATWPRASRLSNVKRICMQPSVEVYEVPKARSTLLHLRGLVLLAAAGIAIVLAMRPEVMAQTRNPLFGHTTSPAVISEQVRLALPSAERGLQLLTSGGDPAQLALGIKSLDESYRYLRAAQESTDLMARRAKFPDPLAQVEMKQMWAVREHMLFCTGQAGHIVNQNQELTEQCVRHVIEGIRQLRVLVATRP